MVHHLNITLLYQGKERDIRIPQKIEVGRLIRELDKIFKMKEIRKKYQLRVVNKGLILDEGKWLLHYPVTTGDVIEIEEISQ